MTVTLGTAMIGQGQPVFIIAEAGVNHNGDPKMAEQLIDAAVESGADAVKFQTFNPQALASTTAEKAAYQIAGSGDGNQLHMLSKLCLPIDCWQHLSSYAQRKGVAFLSTPFDPDSADLLDELNVSGFKISSGDLTNKVLINHVGCMNRPVIISTGMATLGEIESAIDWLTGTGNEQIVVLHCTSLYPTRAQDVNLRCLTTLSTAFPYPVGYSDHTHGLATGVAAVAMGAVVLEKHLTLDKRLPGPDHAMSLDPAEFKRLVAMVREVELAMGSRWKRPTGDELEMKRVARRSIVVTRNVRAGECIERQWLAIKRPGTGIQPDMIDVVSGRRATKDIEADSPLTWDMI